MLFSTIQLFRFFKIGSHLPQWPIENKLVTVNHRLKLDALICNSLQAQAKFNMFLSYQVLKGSLQYTGIRRSFELEYQTAQYIYCELYKMLRTDLDVTL